MRFCLVLLISSVLSIFGCSTKPKPEAVISVSTNTLNPAADGLSIVNIKVKPTSNDLQQKITAFGSSIGDELQSRFSREGLWIRKVEVVDVPAIVASVGEVLDESSVWHGQVVQWRELHQRRIEKGMVISQGGTPYFIHNGFLSLLGRSWIQDREIGIRLYLQFLPTWHVPQSQHSLLGKQKPPLQSKLFKELEVETLLEDNEAILVVTHLKAPKAKLGPHDDGPPPVRLGEALLGGSIKEDIVQFLVIEANILPRG